MCVCVSLKPAPFFLPLSFGGNLSGGAARDPLNPAPALAASRRPSNDSRQRRNKCDELDPRRPRARISGSNHFVNVFFMVLLLAPLHVGAAFVCHWISTSISFDLSFGRYRDRCVCLSPTNIVLGIFLQDYRFNY